MSVSSLSSRMDQMVFLSIGKEERNLLIYAPALYNRRQIWTLHADIFWDIWGRCNIVYFEAGLAYCILWGGEKRTRQVKVSQNTLVCQPSTPPPTPSHVSIFQAGSLRRHNAVKIWRHRGQKLPADKSQMCLSLTHTKLPLLSWPQGGVARPNFKQIAGRKGCRRKCWIPTCPSKSVSKYQVLCYWHNTLAGTIFVGSSISPNNITDAFFLGLYVLIHFNAGSSMYSISILIYFNVK